MIGMKIQAFYTIRFMIHILSSIELMIYGYFTAYTIRFIICIFFFCRITQGISRFAQEPLALSLRDTIFFPFFLLIW